MPRGGKQVFLGFGAFSDQGTDFTSLGGPFIENFQARAARRRRPLPSDSGQYGASLRWFMPDFAQGTELGFFFVNYHSKLPVISGRTGTQAGIGNSLGTLTAVIATAQGLASGLPFDSAVAIAANAGVNAAAANGGDLSPETAAELRDDRGQHRARGRQRRLAGDGPRDARIRADGALLHGVPGGHPALRRFLQHAARDDRRRVAGRGVLPPGRAAAVRRRRTPVRRADAVRGGRARRTGHPDAGELRAGAADALALRPARRLTASTR